MNSESMMSPVQTITFLCSLIMCIIGVATFISALLTRARKDGQLEYKVDEALKGIDEIKKTINQTHTWQESIGLEVQSHEERIRTLFNYYHDLTERVERIERGE
jgi:uncharacterized coiled-coil DUF342 family protein